MSGSSHRTRRLFKEAKGKDIVHSVDAAQEGSFWFSPFTKFDSSLDPIERDEILDMFSDEFGCNLDPASRAAKAKFCELFDPNYDPWEEVHDALDHSDSEDIEVISEVFGCPRMVKNSHSFEVGESSHATTRVEVNSSCCVVMTPKTPCCPLINETTKHYINVSNTTQLQTQLHQPEKNPNLKATNLTGN